MELICTYKTGHNTKQSCHTKSYQYFPNLSDWSEKALSRDVPVPIMISTPLPLNVLRPTYVRVKLKLFSASDSGNDVTLCMPWSPTVTFQYY